MTFPLIGADRAPGCVGLSWRIGRDTSYYLAQRNWSPRAEKSKSERLHGFELLHYIKSKIRLLPQQLFIAKLFVEGLWLLRSFYINQLREAYNHKL